MAKIGVFSDIHGDKKSLDLIVKTFKQSGVGSAMFLGDAVYKTMPDFVKNELDRARNLENSLAQSGRLSKDALDGLFTDKQLSQYNNIKNKCNSAARKIAQQEYLDVQKALSGLDLAVLGGNWDYEDMQDIFGKDYLNASSKDLNGLKVTGFSGGGPAVSLTATDHTIAESGSNHYRPWIDRLASEEPLDSDMLISHLPFMDGEGIHNDNGIQHLKHLISQRKKKGLDVPDLFMYGHAHSSGKVEYDEELEGFHISPGCSSRNHNHHAPTFMICDFDENNKLQTVNRYQINAALDGMSEVKLVNKYSLDHANKKVKVKEEDTIVLEDKDLAKFEDTSLDDHFELNTDYEGKTAQEKDLLLRRNLVRVNQKIEDSQTRVTGALNDALRDWDGKDRKELITMARQYLAEQAKEIFSFQDISYGDDDYLWEDLLNRAAFKIPEKELETKLSTDSVQEIAQQSAQILGMVFQQSIFNNLEAGDLQEMAEQYIPEAYQRAKPIYDKKEALDFWFKSNQGLIDSETVESTGAYQRKSNFKLQKRTKEGLEEMFGNPQDQEDPAEKAYQELGEAIKQGKVPVYSKNGQELVPISENQAIPLDDRMGLQKGDYVPIPLTEPERNEDEITKPLYEKPEEQPSLLG